MTTSDSLQSYYEGYFSRFGNELSPATFEMHRGRYAHNFDRFLKAIAKDAPCLDVGCGVGQFVYYLAAQGFSRVEGIDMDPAMVECARRMVPQAQFTVSGAEEFLADKESAFSLIVMNDVIEHIAAERVVVVLGAIKRALRPGGVLLVKTPNMANPFCLNLRYKDFTHRLGFTESSLGQVFYEAGFRDAEFFEEEGPVTSWRARLRKRVLMRGALRLLRLGYYCMEMNPVPKVLTQWVIARCSKEE